MQKKLTHIKKDRQPITTTTTKNNRVWYLLEFIFEAVVSNWKEEREKEKKRKRNIEDDDTVFAYKETPIKQWPFYGTKDIKQFLKEKHHSHSIYIYFTLSLIISEQKQNTPNCERGKTTKTTTSTHKKPNKQKNNPSDI